MKIELSVFPGYREKKVVINSAVSVWWCGGVVV